MKKFLQTAVLLLLVLGIIYKYQGNIVSVVSPYVGSVMQRLGIEAAPCSQPILYSLGTFDTKFGLSKASFLGALKEAEAIWEKPYGKELFAYTTDGPLKVNLIYDYREEATKKLESLGLAVDDSRASYDSLKAKLNDMKAAFNIAKAKYDQNIQSFNIDQSAYSKEVAYWNSQGGAPKSEYSKLQTEKAALDARANAINIEQKKINDMVNEINALVTVVNSLANKLNINVAQYNTIGASRGESFEEGVYTSDGTHAQIDIYEFSNHDKLVRVLAHELGHALGLEHVDDPKAIMYSLNQGNNKEITPADWNALMNKCNLQTS